MAPKAAQGVTKMINRRCKFLTFRGLFGSVFFTLTVRSCFSFCLCRIEEGRERINTNAAKEGRYLRDLKGSKGVKERAVRLTRMGSSGVSISKLLNAVNSSSWQSIQKPLSYNLDFTNQKLQVLTITVCQLTQSISF